MDRNSAYTLTPFLQCRRGPRQHPAYPVCIWTNDRLLNWSPPESNQLGTCGIYDEKPLGGSTRLLTVSRNLCRSKCHIKCTFNCSTDFGVVYKSNCDNGDLRFSLLILKLYSDGTFAWSAASVFNILPGPAFAVCIYSTQRDQWVINGSVSWILSQRNKALLLIKTAIDWLTLTVTNFIYRYTH